MNASLSTPSRAVTFKLTFYR